MISGVLLDMSGVLYEGNVPLPGAAEAIARLRAAGLPLRFVTNTTRLPKHAVAKKLNAMGMEVEESEIFAPAEAARAWLKGHGRTPHLLVHPDFEQEFEGLPQCDKRAVVIGDAAHAFTFDALNRAFRALMDGADFLALAHNRTFKDADGKLSLDAGAFVKALEFATQKEAIVLGKPSAEFFALALKSMNCPPKEAVMVGDDAESDVAGALRAGLGAALLLRTGKYRAGDEERFDPPPTATLSDIAAATHWILDHKDETPPPLS